MDLRRSDLGLLVALDALLSEGGVTAAANRLNISQPAMSAQLARLRRLFNDPLLVSSGRRMLATPKALELHGPLQNLLRELDMLVRAKADFAPATSREVFRLGGTDHGHSVLSAPLARRFGAEAPNAKLALLPFDAADTWQFLEDGRMDAAAVTSFVVHNEARSRHLFSEVFVFVQRKGHPRGTTPPDLDAFCALDHVLVSPEGGGFIGAVDQALSALGRSRNVVVSLPSFLLAPALIAASDTVGVLPGRVARAFEDSLDIFDLPLDIAGFDLQLIWHPRRQNDPAHIWFRNQIFSLCGP